MEIKNLKKVANRIKKAIKLKEKIILYGDADLDGIASVIVLEETIKNLDGKIQAVYFPDREIEGYGINETALNYLKKFSPALFIALDLGIGNFKEIESAKKFGFEVIIIDHHKVLGNKIPKASLVVDPKQRQDKYPFKGLATAGIAFRLSKLLLGDVFSGDLKNSFLELVALATIADMMPQENENEIFIEEGLKSLENTWRPGLLIFKSLNDVFSTKELASKIISSLNAGEKKEHLHESYLLLKSTNSKEAEISAKELMEKRNLKQARIKEITEETEERIFKKDSQAIIFEGDSSWPLVLLGSVASRICREFEKPTFLFKKRKGKSIGSVRVPKNLDAVKAMESCPKLLETFGGHAPAAGFRIKNENLEEFKECLEKYFKTFCP